MTKQNFIVKALCNLGGDRYTKESTQKSLQNVLQEAQKNVIPIDLHNDKWILFSDLHKGGKNCADDFRLCEEPYITALNYYFERGYNLCVMGDAEELWEEFPRTVIRNNSAAFAAERRFHEAGRYLRLWGNHDEIWGDPELVQKTLQPLYGARRLNVPESILLDVRDGNASMGKILLVHGHQGTQNEGKNTKFSKWILHNIWRPIQVLTGFSCNTPATDWQIRRDRDKIIYVWAANQSKLILIAGHTHVPVFESYSHRARLMAEISNARAEMEKLPENKRIMKLNRIENLSAELQQVENKLSAEEKQEAQPLENPLPCYFNTGCCAFADGDITGLEISAGEIRLVRWPGDDGYGYKVLQAGNLKEIFGTLKQ
jgi:UDP-2,3-diacylglucosamine pyrophosphatase LpxH